MSQSQITGNTAEIESFKLRFLLRQKALPENFSLKGEGFSQETLSKVKVEKISGDNNQEMLLVHFPHEIGGKSLGHSGLKLSGLFSRPSSSGDYVVPADSFRILTDRDLASPLEDLANTPFYLALAVQKEVSGVRKLPSCIENGEIIRVLSVSGEYALVKLRDDVSPSMLNLYGFEQLASRKVDDYGSAYSVPIMKLIEGSEKAIEKLRLQEDGKKSLGAMACRVLGKYISVIAYSMICDGVIGVGMDTKGKNAEDLKKFTELLANSNVHYDHFKVGEGYV